MRGRSVATLLAAGSLALAAACSAAPAAPPDGGDGSGPVVGVVPVRMTEFGLDPTRTSLTPGTYTFLAVNDGSLPHALTVEGDGTSPRHTRLVAPGRSEPLTVTVLRDVDLFCPVTGHRERGMSVHVSVSGPLPAVLDGGRHHQG